MDQFEAGSLALGKIDRLAVVGKPACEGVHRWTVEAPSRRAARFEKRHAHQDQAADKADEAHGGFSGRSLSGSMPGSLFRRNIPAIGCEEGDIGRTVDAVIDRPDAAVAHGK